MVKVTIDIIMSQNKCVNFYFGKLSFQCFDRAFQWIKNAKMLDYWITISHE